MALQKVSFQRPVTLVQTKEREKDISEKSLDNKEGAVPCSLVVNLIVYILRMFGYAEHNGPDVSSQYGRHVNLSFLQDLTH